METWRFQRYYGILFCLVEHSNQSKHHENNCLLQCGSRNLSENGHSEAISHFHDIARADVLNIQMFH